MADTPMIDRRAPVETSWHLKKEINVSLIISVIGISIAAVTGYTDLKRDIALMQADLIHVQAKNLEQDGMGERNMQIVRDTFSRIESKLDRLIERGPK